MDLILWRHAEAHLLREGQSDLDRALTPKGERQAQRMADWLQRRLADSSRVLVSPARRCQETAQALQRPFRTVSSLAPEAGPEALIAAARWPQASGPVLICGHQPTLGQLAALLLTGRPQPWSVRKGAVWWLRHRVRTLEDGSLQTQVLLQAVQGPDLL